MSDSWPAPELRAAARETVLACPDCRGRVSLHWSRRKGGRWVADFWHMPTCPTQRTDRSRRAAERDVIDALAAVLPVADYPGPGRRGDLIVSRHKVAA